MDEFFQHNVVTMKMAVAHFGKSEPTIRKALEFAKLKSAQTLIEEAVGDSEHLGDQPDAPTD